MSKLSVSQSPDHASVFAQIPPFSLLMHRTKMKSAQSQSGLWLTDNFLRHHNTVARASDVLVTVNIKGISNGTRYVCVRCKKHCVK